MKRIENKINSNTLPLWNKFYDLEYNETTSKARRIYYQVILDFFQEGIFSILDIGCGIGDGVSYVKEQRKNCLVAGCDFSDVAIQKAKSSYPNMDFFVFDIYKDILEKQYDYITLVEIIEHLEDPYKCIDKCLKKCKYLIISVPYKNALKKDKEHIITDITEESFRKYTVEKTVIWRKKSSKKSYLTIMLKGIL